MIIFDILLLLMLANGAPIIAKRILGARLAYPLDGGKKFIDGRPWFGTSKTLRGFIFSVIVTSTAAVLLGYPMQTGALFSLASLSGDLVSSFIKRRLALASGSRALFLDQLPESVFPLLLFWNTFELNIATAVGVVSIFFIAEIILSRILYRLHIRDHPY